jgi:accessory gene regulator protein AgrB
MITGLWRDFALSTPVVQIWLGLRFVIVVVAAVLITYLRVWDFERARAGSWRKAHQNLWKKPKRWQLVLFCVLWGIILITFIVAAILNLR